MWGGEHQREVVKDRLGRGAPEGSSQRSCGWRGTSRKLEVMEVIEVMERARRGGTREERHRINRDVTYGFRISGLGREERHRINRDGPMRNMQRERKVTDERPGEERCLEGERGREVSGREERRGG